eukprot:TRINITY_DN10395_c0_g4_i2.p1 TRINITY_DN10395_c0_g4~~TRINITY_DN10395_c0_g4_i2.p1  ORF type:complete len:2156 (+),score=607.81 TRINITY_DN10395_c0_g4_i2:3125-9592(+)
MGVATVTLRQGDLLLHCNGAPSSETVVPWYPDMNESEPFDVVVAAARADGSNAKWPRWRVHGAAAASPAFELTQSMFALQMESGNASAAFAGLRFRSLLPPAPNTTVPSLPTSPVTVTLTFQTMAPVYDEATAGAVPRSTQLRSCEARVVLTPSDRPPPSTLPVVREVRLVGSSAAVPICDGSAEAVGCDKWSAQIADMQQGMFFDLHWLQREGGGPVVDDPTPRNLTIIPATAAGDTLATTTSKLSFVPIPSGRGQTYPNIPIPSFWNSPDTTGTSTGGTGYTRTYTFGQLAVRFVRTPVEGSRSQLFMQYDDKGGVNVGVGWPVRDARMKLCGTLWLESAREEVLEANNGTDPHVCTTMRLWLRPDPTEKRSLAFWEWETVTAKVAGVGNLTDGVAQCSPTAASLLRFSIVTAYHSLSTVTAPNTSFIVYDVPMRYQLSMGSQVLAPRSDMIIRNRTVFTTGGPPANASESSRVATELTTGLRGLFEVYGVGTVAIGVSAQVNATAFLDGWAVNGATTSLAYTFALGAETYASWEVLNEVQHDDECPSGRLLPRRDQDGYRTYTVGVPPAAGWGYGSGAVAHAVFPVQAVVLSTRTDQNPRAWTFASESSSGDSIVDVRKHSWAGCGDGGRMTLHQLEPSRADGQFSVFETLVSALRVVPVVRMRNGVATAWVSLAEPCESCTLELRLCYVAAQKASECLAGPIASVSDRLPPHADRTRITKPFAVARSAPPHVQVHHQNLPQGVVDGTVYVGQAFEVTVEAVQVFAGWVYRGSEVVAVDVTADAEWHCDGNDCKLGASLARYGNGGFLQAIGTEAERASRHAAPFCAAVTRESMAAATLWPRHSVSLSFIEQSGADLSFYFTRPCSSCRVVLRFSPPLGKAGPSGTIVLRSYSSTHVSEVRAPLTFAVRACATRWAWAGRAPSPAVRRLRPFSLNVWRTDGNLNPVWHGSAQALFFPETASEGNGGGGELVATSPGATELRGAGAVDGSAMVRLEYARACYRCYVTLAGGGHGVTASMAVLAPASRIVAIPLQPLQVEVATNRTNDTSSTQWRFAVYAADEIGDRSYTPGPTFAAAQPLWSPHMTQPSTLSVVGRTVTQTLGGQPLPTGGSLTTPVVDSQGAAVVTTVTDGSAAAVSVVNGTSVFDGVPKGGDAPSAGVAVVEMSGTSSFYPLQLTIDGTVNRTVDAFGRDVVLTRSVRATHLAVGSPLQHQCTGRPPGDTCSLRAYSIGAATGDLTAVYEVAAVTDTAAQASVSCDAAGCQVEVDSEAAFRMGVASFAVRYISGSDCNCSVTVSADGLEYGTQTVSVSFGSSPPATRFEWVSATNAAANRTTALQLAARPAEDQAGVMAAAVAWVDAATVTLNPAEMSPDGCFQLTHATVTDSGRSVTIAGSFTSADEFDVCEVRASAVVSAPLPVSTHLRATVLVPAAIRLVTVPAPGAFEKVSGQPERRLNFTGLVSRAATGEPAAVTGLGAVLSVEVVDAQQRRVLGETGIVLTVNVSGPAGYTVLREAVPASGLAEVTIHSDPTTTSAPLFVSAAAAGEVVGGANWTAGGITDVGPLYFVRRTKALNVSVVLGSEPAVQLLEHGSPNASASAVHWVHGYTFGISIAAVDYVGAPSGEPVDVTFSTKGVPCVRADRAASGWCAQGAAPCRHSPFYAMPPCGSSGWTAEGEPLESVSIPADGPASVASALYTGDVSGRQYITFAASGGWELNPVYTFTTSIVMQRVQRLCVLGSDGRCVECAPHPDPDRATTVDQCRLPLNQTSFARDSLPVLRIAIVDADGAVVLGDSDMGAVVRSTCEADAAFVGRNGSFGSPPRYRARNGVFELADLQFDAGCGNATLLVAPLQGAADVLNQASTLRGVETTGFEVLALDGETPAPREPPPPPVAVEVALRTFPPAVASVARGEVQAFCNKVGRTAFNTAFGRVLRGVASSVVSARLGDLCGTPTGTVSAECLVAPVDDTAAPDYGCFCCETVGAARLAPALQLGPAVNLTARASVNVELDRNTGAAYNDNPQAVAALIDEIGAALQSDLESPTSVLKGQGGEAFAYADAASLDVSGRVKVTPAPPDGALTPKPTQAPTASPVTSAPSQSPSTSQPSAPPSQSPQTARPTEGPVIDVGPVQQISGGGRGAAAAVLVLAASLLAVVS